MRACPSGRGGLSTRCSCVPAEVAAGTEAVEIWEQLMTLGLMISHPMFLTFSVSGNVQGTQEGGDWEQQDANWITLPDFIL